MYGTGSAPSVLIAIIYLFELVFVGFLLFISFSKPLTRGNVIRCTILLLLSIKLAIKCQDYAVPFPFTYFSSILLWEVIPSACLLLSIIFLGDLLDHDLLPSRLPKSVRAVSKYFYPCAILVLFIVQTFLTAFQSVSIFLYSCSVIFSNPTH